MEWLQSDRYRDTSSVSYDTRYWVSHLIHCKATPIFYLLQYQQILYLKGYLLFRKPQPFLRRKLFLQCSSYIKTDNTIKVAIFKPLQSSFTFLSFAMHLIVCQLKLKPIVSILLICLLQFQLSAQSAEPFIYGDALPDAPALSARGEYPVGVRTMDWVNANQLNVLKAKDGVTPLYNRPLKVEIWYPAIIPNGKKELVTYIDVLGSATDSTRPIKPFN